MSRQTWGALGVLLLTACASDDEATSAATTVAPTAVAITVLVTSAGSSPETDEAPATIPATVASTEATASTVSLSTVDVNDSDVAPTIPPTSTAVTTTSYVVPVANVAAAGWGDTHGRGYPATDVFVGCGATIVSPVNGTVLEVRRIDSYDPAVDNPATAGGRSLAVLGDDGVRYYLAHFETIDELIEPGARVSAGEPLGQMGATGRASGCHVHFGISPPCPGKEWSVRRGVVWPYPYLDAWRTGQQLSPAEEIADWIVENPLACETAMADPQAGDA